MRRNTNNTIITQANTEYGRMFKKIISNYLSSNKHLPIEVADVYNGFLFTVPKHMESYDEERGVPLHTYLGIKCRFYVREEIRQYSKKKHGVLNNRVKFNENIMSEKCIANSPSLDCKLNMEVFSNEENEIIQEHFVRCCSVRKLSMIMDTSAYKLSKKIIIIKEKVMIQIKKNKV